MGTPWEQAEKREFDVEMVISPFGERLALAHDILGSLPSSGRFRSAVRVKVEAVLIADTLQYTKGRAKVIAGGSISERT